MRAKTPWEIHPDLTNDRLTAVARLLERGRNDALDRFDPSIGDDSWTLGCRAFQFARFQIAEAVTAGLLPWLSVQDPSKQFVFRIGAVPVRFYRGPADEPTSRTLQQSYPELRQLSLSFPGEDEWRHCAFRFAIETDLDGFIVSITFVALLDETPVLTWDIPLSPMAIPISPIGTTPAEGVDLPAPVVRMPGVDSAESA